MISVVIPAYNEEETIGKCLLAFCNQRTQRPFEVIVVDNDSSDRTADVVRSFRDRLNVRVITVSGRRRGNARFHGFKTAKGDIILSTDADTIIPPHWVESYGRIFENPSVGAATGTYRITDCAWHINLFFDIWNPAWIYICRVAWGTFTFRGSNFGIRRAVYMQAGQFDQHADMYEDADLAWRVSKVTRITYDYSLTIEASGRRFRGGLLKGGYEYIRGMLHRFIYAERYVQFSNAR
jgi:glycosyltransferase involved in cell wall biosynthesis